MTQSARIEVEPDPVPIVLILAATLRRAARTPKLASAIGKVKGNVALKSTTDPQAATMRFGNGGVTVVRGVSDDTDVLIAADLNTMADENAPTPKVVGAARHPKLALTVGKLLEPPHGTWQEEAERFFDFAIERPGVPRSMRVVCTDDGSELVLGDPPVGVRVARQRARPAQRLPRQHRARPRPARRQALRGRQARAPRRAHRSFARMDVRAMTMDATQAAPKQHRGSTNTTSRGSRPRASRSTGWSSASTSRRASSSRRFRSATRSPSS